MRAVQALGKPYFNKNASPSEGIPKVPGAQAISWSLASHLLARGPSEALAALAIYMGDDTNSSTDWGFIEPGGVLYQQLTPAIGHPCEDQQTAGANVFTRRYSGGFVVVNANAPGSELVSVTLPENGVFQGPQSVTVPPETGVVVLSAPGHPLCP
jgi:hypothetical protein